MWVVYVLPNRKAHDRFAYECRKAGAPAEPVRDESGAVVLAQPDGSFHRGTGAPLRADGYPVAYEVSATGDALARIRGLSVVTRTHPLIKLSRLGNGSGAGELTDRTRRILRAERHERGYRAGEIVRGGIRENAAAPAAPAGAAFRIPDASELVPASAVADGWRVVGAKQDGAELAVTLRLSDTAQRITVRVPLEPVTDGTAQAAAERRRADELARLSPPATEAETLRAFGMARAPRD
ncbi:hypothetical protein [Urbifossiella limnaea]|uniref:hypothetical protein n=1 Tax=Urbifossiella limnaea TaxID=2528023 RepID=UPI0011A77F55|nr:hypothetical protein [Urbifossiella limnaea]